MRPSSPHAGPAACSTVNDLPARPPRPIPTAHVQSAEWPLAPPVRLPTIDAHGDLAQALWAYGPGRRHGGRAGATPGQRITAGPRTRDDTNASSRVLSFHSTRWRLRHVACATATAPTAARQAGALRTSACAADEPTKRRPGPPWLRGPIDRQIAARRSSGNGGCARGRTARRTRSSGLSSPAVRPASSSPQTRQRRMSTHSPPPRTAMAIGSMAAPHSASRSPGRSST